MYTLMLTGLSILKTEYESNYGLYFKQMAINSDFSITGSIICDMVIYFEVLYGTVPYNHIKIYIFSLFYYL